MLYVLTTSCAWYLLAKTFPPYSTVYYYFRQWRDDGTWKRVDDHLVQWVRVLEDHPSTPSAASLHSQSVATAIMVNEAVGYDAAKKSKGLQALYPSGHLRLVMKRQVGRSQRARTGRSQTTPPSSGERA